MRLPPRAPTLHASLRLSSSSLTECGRWIADSMQTTCGLLLGLPATRRPPAVVLLDRDRCIHDRSAAAARPTGLLSSRGQIGTAGCGMAVASLRNRLPSQNSARREKHKRCDGCGSCKCPPGTPGKPVRLELTSSSRRFGPNFSCLAKGLNESMERRPIRMQLARNAQ